MEKVFHLGFNSHLLEFPELNLKVSLTANNSTAPCNGNLEDLTNLH